MNNPDNEIVLLQTFSTDTEAHLAQGYLQSHGIEAILDNETLARIYPLGFTGWTGIRMMVRRSDLDEARRLLEERPQLPQ